MIKYRTLGNVELSDPEAERTFSLLAHPKRVALLTYLVQASPSGFRRRDSLLAMFWPEMDEHRARRALNQAVYRLRQELGEHAVVSRGQDEVGIQESVLWSDVTAFRRAIEGHSWTEALDLYRGDLLPGFHLSGANDFEDWLSQERAGLRELAGEAAWAAASASAQQGLNVEASKLARRAAGYVNEDEVALRRLLSFLGDLGDRAGALAAYAAFAERLDNEYGATPAPETKEVVAAIRASVVNGPGGGPPPSVSQTDDEEVLAKPATGGSREDPAPSPVGVQPPTAARTHDATTIGLRRRTAWIGTSVAVAAALAVTVVLGRQADAADPMSLVAYRHYLDSLERSRATGLEAVMDEYHELLGQAVRASADFTGVPTVTGTADFQLYGADQVRCSGALDRTSPRGSIEVLVSSAGLELKAVLQGAEPNRNYLVTLDDCSNPLRLANPLVTDSVGNGSLSGFFSLGSGTHLIVITLSTTRPVGDPANRDTGTIPFRVIVP